MKYKFDGRPLYKVELYSFRWTQFPQTYPQRKKITVLLHFQMESFLVSGAYILVLMPRQDDRHPQLIPITRPTSPARYQ